MKAPCPVCGRVVGVYVPKGGDGSAVRPGRHGDCAGRFHVIDRSEVVESYVPDADDREWARRHLRGLIP